MQRHRLPLIASRASSSVGSGLSRDVGGDRGEEAGRAEAALQPVALAERLLHRVHVRPARAEPLDRGHLVAVDRHREQQAGPHRLAVEQHRAGAADAVLAADVRAGQPQVVAQEVGQQPARRHAGVARHAVDGQPYVVQRVGVGHAVHAALPGSLGERPRGQHADQVAAVVGASRGCRPPGRPARAPARRPRPSRRPPARLPATAAVRSSTSGVGATET